MPTKAPVAPAVEGTSVMPRQRPKGSSATPLNLPLALNTSPTATKKMAQSPVTFGESQFARSGTSFPSNTSTFPVKPENFPVANQFQNSQSFFAQKEGKEKSLDTLFNSTMYPDPFREEARSKGTFTVLFVLMTCFFLIFRIFYFPVSSFFGIFEVFNDIFFDISRTSFLETSKCPKSAAYIPHVLAFGISKKKN